MSVRSSASAELIVTNARVWTVDAAKPEAQAVAVRGDRIVAVGTIEEISAFGGQRTRRIDAAGRFLMPGFHDAHLHLMMAAEGLGALDLKDAATPEEFARRTGEQAKATPKGEWITGGNWDEQEWPDGKLPTCHLIDRVAPDTPVFVYRHDRHMAVANSLAMRLAGVTRATPDLPGGEIRRDAQGDPTGVFKDAACAYIERVIPQDSPDKRARTLTRALRHMAELGVTSVQDMGPTPENVDLFTSFAVEGRLTSRIRVVWKEEALAKELESGSPKRWATTPFFSVSGAKGFSDGSLGSGTALFFEPYADDPNSVGMLTDEMQPLDGIRNRLVALDKAGEQLVIHAIGDKANSMVLDLLADVERANGRRPRQARIEHAQHVAPADFARFAQLGVIASVQPYHAIDDGRWAERRLGAERLKGTYAFRSFLDHGVRLAIGTDWPVAPLNPMLTVCAAVTRATLDGKHPQGWVPEQKLTVAEVLEGYTLGAAYAAREESEKGSITPGKLADLVLLDADPFAVAPEALGGIRVVLTMVGGTVIYDARAEG